MRKENLKVGYSFDMVSILNDGDYTDAFDTERSTIGKEDEYICNTDFYRKDRALFRGINALYVHHSGVKKLGKLTITKVK